MSKDFASTALNLGAEQFSDDELARLQADARAAGRHCVVDGVVRGPGGALFVMRRGAHRRNFPNCWDLPGGRLESGETLREALAREIGEETGWHLRQIRRLLLTSDWEENRPDGTRYRQFDFLVDVAGDLSRPVIPEDEFDEWAWLPPDQLNRVMENRLPGDDLIHRVLQAAAKGTEGAS